MEKTISEDPTSRPEGTGAPGLRGKVVLAVALTAAIFLLLGLYGDLKQVGASFFSFRWVLLPLILGLSCVNYLLRFLKWDSYLRALGVPLRGRESLAVFLAGLAMSVTPAKFGEVLKSFLVKQRCGIPVSRTAPVVFAERVTDFVALALITLFGCLGSGKGGAVPVVGLVLLALLLGGLSQRRMWARWIRLAGRIPRSSAWARRLEAAYESTLHLLRPRQMLLATALSLPAWVAEGAGCYLVFRGLDVQVPLHSAVALYALSTLVGALTMLPGGIVGTEGSLTALTIMQGASRPVAVSGTILIRLCTLWFAVAIGIAVFLRLERQWNRTARSQTTGQWTEPIHQQE